MDVDALLARALRQSAVLLITDERGVVIHASERSAALLGASLVGQGLEALFAGEGGVMAALWPTLRAGETWTGAFTRKDRAQVAEDIRRCYDYFPRLRERRQQQAGTLSGGEQQMLAISRALMLRPRLLLLDEPSFGLAPLVVQEIFRIMQRIREEQRVSILLVEQNASLALKVADHAYLLETGRVVLGGPAEVVRSDEAVRKSYLGY